MRKQIPQAVLAVVADHVSSSETHDTLDSLFKFAGCPGEPPQGSKRAKALAWLRAVNSDTAVPEPLQVLGKIIEASMDASVQIGDFKYQDISTFRQKIGMALAAAGLRYRPGGVITGVLATPTTTLETFIKQRDERAISDEFERAAVKAESEPREAVSAAANILESLCKHYIAEKGLEMPSKQVLGELWGVVRRHLGFDPAQVADDDLRGILSGLIQVVNGLAAFRTHTSSAHGAGPKAYRLQARQSKWLGRRVLCPTRDKKIHKRISR